MLDDLKIIHEKDTRDALGVATKQWQQLQHHFDIDHFKESHGQVDNVVLSGMGGSALAAELSLSWPGYKKPFEICRQYHAPGYVGEQTLFIASSYSGNTEETLHATSEALDRGAHVVVIASGGKLEEIAHDRSLPFIKLVGGLQPRMATLYTFRALITMLSSYGVLRDGDLDGEIWNASLHLEWAVGQWQADVRTPDNYAKQIAQECAGRSVVIYGGPLLFPAAYKWKISMNENAKNIAWCNRFPEFNHNEFLGWSSHPTEKPYAVVYLQSSFDEDHITKRFTITEQLLSGRWPTPEHISAQGDTPLKHLLWSVLLGDFVSIYLAILNDVDPTPVALIEKLKSRLSADPQ